MECDPVGKIFNSGIFFNEAIIHLEDIQKMYTNILSAQGAMQNMIKRLKRFVEYRLITTLLITLLRFLNLI